MASTRLLYQIRKRRLFLPFFFSFLLILLPLSESAHVLIQFFPMSERYPLECIFKFVDEVKQYLKHRKRSKTDDAMLARLEPSLEDFLPSDQGDDDHGKLAVSLLELKDVKRMFGISRDPKHLTRCDMQNEINLPLEYGTRVSSGSRTPLRKHSLTWSY